MKKSLAILCVLSFVVVSFAFMTSASAAQGDSSNPWIISNCGELSQMDASSEYFVLSQSFACSGNFTPIDTFNGHLDGNSNTISNITIVASASSGMFVTNGGVVQNLYLTNISISTAGFGTGSLAGTNGGEIDNVHAQGSITSTGDLVGGLVGDNSGGNIDHSSADVTVTGNQKVGGLVGVSENSNALIENSYATGDVTGAYAVGGFLGYADDGSVVNRSYATGRVISDAEAGGFVGHSNTGDYDQDFATGGANGTNAGGFAGFMRRGTVTNSYARGFTSTGNASGSFAGELGCSLNLNNLYATGITLSFGSTNPFIGIAQCGSGIDAANSYWDVDTVSGTEGDTDHGAVGKTTAHMKDQATFTGWDFATTPIWAIDSNFNDGYPYLVNNDGVPPTTTTTTTTTTSPVTTTAPPSSATIELSSSNVSPGSHLTVTVNGLQANSSATITLESTPVLLATVTAGASGTFSKKVTIPASTPLGQHHIVVAGVDAHGNAITFTAQLSVSQLPATGFDSRTYLLDVLVLLGVGLVLAVMGRKRTLLMGR